MPASRGNQIVATDAAAKADAKVAAGMRYFQPDPVQLALAKAEMRENFNRVESSVRKIGRQISTDVERPMADLRQGLEEVRSNF